MADQNTGANTPGRGGFVLRHAGTALLLVLLLAVWTVDSPLTQDGASHVANAAIVKKLIAGNAGMFGEWQQLHSTPNWLTTALVAAAMPPLAPEAMLKLLISAALLLSWFGLRSLAGAAGAGTHDGAGVFLFAVTNNWFVWMGFFNFTFAAALSCIALAWFLRRMDRWKPLHAAALLALAAAVALAHPFPAVLLAGGLLLTAAGASSTVREALARAGFAVRGITRAAAASAAAASLLMAALTVALGRTVQSGSGGTSVSSIFRRPDEIGAALLYFPVDAFEVVRVPHANAGYWLALAAVLAALTLAGDLRGRGLRALASPALLAAAGFAVARLVFSDSPGAGAFVSVRFSLLAAGALVLYAWRRPAAAAPVVAVLALATVSVGLAAQIAAMRTAGAAVADFRAGLRSAGLPEGARFVRVMYPMPVLRDRARLRFLRVDPLMHAQSWLSLETGGLDFTNYEALTAHFPNTFRPERLAPDVRLALSALGESPADAAHAASLERVLSALGPEVDAVIVAGENGTDWNAPGAGVFEVPARHGFRLASQTGSPVYLRVFQRAPRVAGSR